MTDASSNNAANLEGIDNTGAGQSQTTDTTNHAISNRVRCTCDVPDNAPPGAHRFGCELRQPGQ